MVKTLRVNEALHKRLTRMGFVGQTVGELLEDILDFIDENEEEFDSFLDSRYDAEEK